MKNIAAKLVFSGLAILMAIAPVPFEKWAWQRIAFGIIGLTGMVATKTGIDKESEEQRVADIYDHEERQREKEFKHVQRTLELEAAQRQEAVRFGLQTQMLTADYQGAFVTLMEEKHPYYLDVLQAQQQSALDAQKRAYSAESGLVNRVGEAIEVGAIGSETGINLETGVQQTSIPKYLRSFVSTTCLAWGAQGSGKSWFVRYLAKIKVDKGYRVIVFDPNSNQAAWRGVELINTYEAIEEKMRWYIEEVMSRYQVFTASDYDEDVWRAQLWTDGKAISVICEEVTTYADFIPDTELVKQFIKVATTLSRKQEMPVTFVTHNNTQTCFGNIKGLGQLIADMQQIKLIPKTDSQTDQPVASGRAQVRSNSEQNWVDVTVPRITSKITDFTRITSAVSTQEQSGVVDSTASNSVDNFVELHQNKTDTTTSIEAQKEQLDATFSKTYNPLDHFMQEASQEELEEMIKTWREMADTSQQDVSDTVIQKNASDTYQEGYQAPEPAQGKGSRRTWDVSDFRKNLPNRQEEVMFQELDTFFQNVSRSPSRIIKEAWGLSNGEIYNSIGKPCFVYLVTKHGTDEHKNSPKFAKHISEYLASADDSNDE